MAILRPLCFVAMPFGQKLASSRSVDFNAIYQDLIAPAIKAAGLQPLRADEEQVGGIIHKPMFERLVLCDYAIGDLTMANANVFYEIGVRHAAKPATTVLIIADEVRLPFDVAMLSTLTYRLGVDGKPSHLTEDRDMLAARLVACKRDGSKDSPLYQLIDAMQPPTVDSDKTDVFRHQVEYAESKKEELAKAREEGIAAIDAVRATLNPIEDVEAGVVIDLMLSYRAVKAWQQMVALVAEMPRPLRETVMVQEQLGLALNRAGRGAEAERVLTSLIAKRRESSETLGILGRVYKDRYETAIKAGDGAKARGLLDKAIETYRRGFEADWRDHYPGVNAVTLMELKEPPDPTRLSLLPVVRYSVERRIACGKPDYWDWATMLELCVIQSDKAGAASALDSALAHVREIWEPETTARNLRLIRTVRDRRGEDTAWIRDTEAALSRKK